ncbi:polo-like kinase 1 [Nematocida sp. AWRm80]|nr:polo-like kinase 1 [Nematocida sp. AWRm80]
MKNAPFLPIGSIVNDKESGDSFRIVGLIGQGGFAQCFSVVKHDTNEEFAAKIIKKSELVRPKNKQKLLSEIKIHLSVHHKNIVKLYTYFEDKSFVFLIMEMCHNKSMMDMLKRKKKIEESYVKVFLMQTVDALKYLHQVCSVVHRDMKLANLFLDKNFNIKVGDFGLAAVINQQERKNTICGTPNYIAPEVLFNSTDGHSFEVDIWSLGVIVYTMIVGKPPFQKSDVKEIYKSIKINSYSYPEDCVISESAKELIGGLLELDPQKRLTLDQIYESEFVKSYFKERQAQTLPADPALIPITTTRPEKQPNTQPTTQQPSTLERILKQQSETASKPEQEKKPEPKVSETEVFYEVPKDKPTTTRLGLLSAVHMRVLACLNTNTSSTPALTHCPIDHITATVDYTNKYGLGYLLASGTIGILFNDSTSIVLRPEAVKNAQTKNIPYSFEYLEHKLYGIQKIITKEKQQSTNIPPRLNKKSLLITHFINGILSNALYKILPVQEDNVFVIKHINFPLGPVLRLSNRSVIFIIDGIPLVFFNEGTGMYYSARSSIPRRILSYCHEVLSSLIKK